jgi:hypothetical protein
VRFSYVLYGRSLISDRCFPELAGEEVRSLEDTPFANVKFAPTPDLSRINPNWFLECVYPGGQTWLRCAKIDERYLLRYYGAADFVLDRHKREILCSHVARGTSEATLRHILLDGVLPLFMNLLGRDALHATAVATRAGVVAFVGPTGAGKSTLAGSFVQRGIPLFCDDCLVLEEHGQIVGIPGYWGLRLWPDSRQALRVGGDGHVPPDFKSRSLASRAAELLCREAMPLVRVYHLTREPGVREPRIEPLMGRQAIARLIEAAYRLDVSDKAMLARQFRLLSRAAQQSAVRTLVLPSEFSALPSVQRAVLDDLRVEA